MRARRTLPSEVVHTNDPDPGRGAEIQRLAVRQVSRPEDLEPASG
jgi:hypothetical protein